MKLNLEAKTKEQGLIKAYLEENAGEPLAGKINGGTPFVKDGKTLINRKTLDGFFRYASDEARKLASKGAQSACVEDKVVYGWAIHYFEEESIEGTLYNEDGSEYRKPPAPPGKDRIEKNRRSNSRRSRRCLSLNFWTQIPERRNATNRIFPHPGKRRTPCRPCRQSTRKRVKFSPGRSRTGQAAFRPPLRTTRKSMTLKVLRIPRMMRIPAVPKWTISTFPLLSPKPSPF